MSAYPFGRRVDRHVCTPLERTEKVAAHTEGVVHHHAYAFAASHFHNRLIIRNIEGRIADVFKEYSLGAAVYEGLKVRGAVALCKAHLYAHIAECDGEHCEGASIEERLCHDVVAGAADVGDGEEHCRLAGSCRHSRNSAFERCHPLLEHLVGGVGDSCIYIARALQLEELRAVLHTVEGICSTLIYRNCSAF